MFYQTLELRDASRWEREVGKFFFNGENAMSHKVRFLMEGLVGSLRCIGSLHGEK